MQKFTHICQIYSVGATAWPATVETEQIGQGIVRCSLQKCFCGVAELQFGFKHCTKDEQLKNFTLASPHKILNNSKFCSSTEARLHKHLRQVLGKAAFYVLPLTLALAVNSEVALISLFIYAVLVLYLLPLSL